ncbi:MAG: penicillin-binding transpeptidase domain-containing protein [Erysipelotrichaceae bacterium]
MKRSRNMLLFTLFILSSILLVVAINVFFISIIGYHFNSQTDLKAYSANVNTVNQTLQAKRGFILDRNGEIIAQDNETYTIYAIVDSSRPSYKDKPAYVVDIDSTADTLAIYLNAPADYIKERLLSASYQTEFGIYGKSLSLIQKEEIESLELSGIGFSKTLSRYYPLNHFASYLIGFVNQENNKTVGMMGIEGSYNTLLAGKDGNKVAVVDRYGYSLPGYPEEVNNPQDGYNVVLTIDRAIQEQLESSFLMTKDLFNAYEVWGTVMEVKTGKILAVGQYPSFDPNKKDITEYQSYLTQKIYEPGSTLKAFTYAAAIDSGNYNGNDTFNSNVFVVGLDKNGDAIRLSSSTNSIGSIRNANSRSWGNITYDIGFAYSSNVGIASLLTNYLDDEIFMEYLVRFGFKNKVNIENMSETIGSINYTWPLDKLTVGYGQGISINMAQMLQAYTAIFNEGTMIKPYLVEKVINSKTNEVIESNGTTVIGQAIKPETAEKVQSLMDLVVNYETGTGRFYKVDEVNILAKTGTAQLIVDNEYSKDQYIYSVVIGLPADNPEIMIYYAFNAPVNNNAHVETTPIKQLVRTVALVNNYRNEKTTGENLVIVSDINDFKLKNYINHSLDYALNDLQNKSNKIFVLGDGSTVINQYPKADINILSNQPIFLLTSTNNIQMIDLIGMNKKDVLSFFELIEANYNLVGEGVVVSSSLGVSEVINLNEVIEVVFE